MGKRGDAQLDAQMSLLDCLAYCVGCTMLSDLHHMTRLERSRLVHALEQMAPEDASLKDWNDALVYLTGASAEPTAAAARARLINSLSGSDFGR